MLINSPPTSPAPRSPTKRCSGTGASFLQVAGLGAAAVGGLLPFRGQGILGSNEEKLTPGEDVTGYNNYYEFGTGKDDPARARP